MKVIESQITNRVDRMTAEDGNLDNKIVFVTGAGSGIGEATAKLCAAEGATVIVSDVRLDVAESVAGAIRATGGKADAADLDVTDEATWQSVMAGVAERHGKLDVLVNSAGISVSKPIVETTLDEWRKVMTVNLDGVFLGTKYAIAAMKNGGSIVNVASVSGITPSAGGSNYCASKAAVRIFSKTAAIECADAKNGIRVNVVTPGGVKTPMWEKEEFFKALIEDHGGTEEAYAAMAGDTPSHQFFTPEEVAQTNRRRLHSHRDAWG